SDADAPSSVPPAPFRRAGSFMKVSNAAPVEARRAQPVSCSRYFGNNEYPPGTDVIMLRLMSVLVCIIVAAIAPAVPTVEAVDLPTTPPVYKFPRELQKEYPLIQQDEIEKMIGTHDAKLLVINFWSTSCAPCLEELPFFQKAHEKYRDKGMRLVGYNTDYDLYGDEWE